MKPALRFLSATCLRLDILHVRDRPSGRPLSLALNRRFTLKDEILSSPARFRCRILPLRISLEAGSGG